MAHSVGSRKSDLLNASPRHFDFEFADFVPIPDRVLFRAADRSSTLAQQQLVMRRPTYAVRALATRRAAQAIARSPIKSGRKLAEAGKNRLPSTGLNGCKQRGAPFWARTPSRLVSILNVCPRFLVENSALMS